MRAPEASLVQARAKAPLPTLKVLHLSSANIECIKHLELCKSLHSLYADSNYIKDADGLIELKKLWRIDLNDNLLKNLHALASFRVLGFLYLERNRICFEDLVCLRDQHLLEVRLLGNDGLLKGNTTEEYRKKVVALLPNAWILDGHFISTKERQQAIEECDSYVTSLLNLHSKFGSATDMYWVNPEFVMESNSLAASLIDIAHESSSSSSSTESLDLRRLYAIVSLHNKESHMHNMHCHFAPSRHASNARSMPKIWLDEVLALPRQIRVDVIVLLSSFILFRFPKVLLLEALTIQQLDCPHFPSEAIQDTVNLPSYALVALIAIARHVTLKTEHLMQTEDKPEAINSQFKHESELLRSIPLLFVTLLNTDCSSSDDSGTAMRSRRAIKLLSNAASFPGPETVASKGKGKRRIILSELLPLIRAAESDSRSSTAKSTHGEVALCVVVPSHKNAITCPIALNVSSMPRKRNMTPQTCDDTANSTPEEAQEDKWKDCISHRARTAGSTARCRPKPGDWVDVYSKQFMKVQDLSMDGQSVVVTLPTDTSWSLILSLKQLLRSSNSVWRVNYLTKQQSEALSANFNISSTRLGKLHRDSESFHRHGIIRNQGFPNHFVTAQLLKDMNREQKIPNSLQSSGQTKTIEIFSSNDTLDANFVLTSPELISAQNYCAANSFLQQRLSPRGLWSPMKQCAPYSVLDPSLTKSSSSKDLKPRKLRAMKQETVAETASQPQQTDDWLEIRRAMQIQLGMIEDNRFLLPSSVSDSGLETHSGTSVISTEASGSAVSQTIASVSSDCTEWQGHVQAMTSPPLSSIGSQELVGGSNMKLATTRGWRQLSTKTEFVVTVPLSTSHSAPLVGQTKTSKLKLMLPSISQNSK